MRFCGISDCSNKHYGKNLCQKHYYRQYHRGTTSLVGNHHGMNNTPEYRAWASMKTRCYNIKHSSYKYYGGRGIKVCDRWIKSFNDFYKDMGDKPSKQFSLDRINCEGDYSPSNCRWADWSTQNLNRRFITSKH